MILSARLACCLSAVAMLCVPLPAAAQLSASDLALRISRLEEQNRQLNGRIEELQHGIHRMEEQLKRFQGDVDYRVQELEGRRGGSRPAAQPPQRRSDAGQIEGPARPSGGFAANAAGDPGRPAPGPQTLGSIAGDPDDRGGVGAPLVIAPEYLNPGANAPVGAPVGAPAGRAGAPPSQRLSATAPPSNSPDDEYALASGFLQRRDYELAEVQFRDFLSSHPKDRRVADALYGLGESYFHRSRYNDAIEPFLKVVTEYGSSARAPESMLRLGMTLAAIQQKEQACATFGEIGRKFPRAANVRAQADREMQRARC